MKDSTSGKFGPLEIEKLHDCLINHDSSISWATEFEEKFSNHIGAKYCISCNSGTSGLHAALYAAGVSEGDEVIIPSLTVIMDAYAGSGTSVVVANEMNLQFIANNRVAEGATGQRLTAKL